MKSELYINATSSEVVIALLHDKRLKELNRERSDAGFSVGDILLGKTKKIMPGLNAAFIIDQRVCEELLRNNPENQEFIKSFLTLVSGN